MIKLVAAQYESGICCIIFGGRFLLVKPPYQQDKFERLTSQDISKAIVAQGFKAEDLNFESWEALFGHLHDKLLQVA